MDTTTLAAEKAQAIKAAMLGFLLIAFGLWLLYGVAGAMIWIGAVLFVGGLLATYHYHAAQKASIARTPPEVAARTVHH